MPRKPSPRRIRILLVDDHPVVREGIRSYLTKHEHLEIVGEAEDGAAAIELARQLVPDVVLMDINMPGMNGLAATAQLQDQLPEVRVLILTVHNSKEYILPIVRCGASGYVLKDTSPVELIRAIEAVYRRESFFSPPVTKVVLDDYRQHQGQQSRAPKEGLALLSPREKQVLGYIAREYTNKEIATELLLGVRTVETHRERIMSKLAIRSTAGLTKFAIAAGIVPLEEPR